MAKSDKTETSQETETPQDTAADETVKVESVETDIAQDEADKAEVEDVVTSPEPEDSADPMQADDEGTAEDAPAADEPAPAEEDMSSDPSAEPTEPTPAKRGGFVPMALGGVVAAAIGFGGATYMQSQGMLLGADKEALSSFEATLAEQERAIDELRAAQGDIAAKAESAIAASTDAKELEARIDGLSARIESVAQDMIAFGARLTEAEKRPMSDGLSASAVEAYEREVEELRAQVAAQLAEAKTLKANSDQTARKTLVQAALTRITAALESGAPYEAALVDLANASGESAPAALADPAAEGVATLPALIEAFPDVARAALAEARKQQSGEDTGSRLGAFLKAQLGARSVAPKEGSDPDAVLSRAEAALRDGALKEALAEIETLPAESQAKMASWREAAETRAAALAAAEALALGLTE
ncbi:MAG: hypothetical protein OQK05_07275 [Pseudopelagicola sp.]|nr:hypothetical protein [Pseudopelagicola sp.]